MWRLVILRKTKHKYTCTEYFLFYMKTSNKFKILWKLSYIYSHTFELFPFKKMAPVFAIQRKEKIIEELLTSHGVMQNAWLGQKQRTAWAAPTIQCMLCAFYRQKTYWKAEKGHLNLSFYWYFRDLDDDLLNNYCRNPGHGTRPWCITNKYMCTRGYCDVCGIGKLFS